MRLYLYGACTLAILGGIYMFYGWAYDKGYERHRLETDTQAVQCVMRSRADMVTAGQAVQKAQEKIQRKKTQDEVCRDILNFDVRECL